MRGEIRNLVRKAVAKAKVVTKATRRPRRGPWPPDPARVRSIIDGLEELYPDVDCELDRETPFQLVCATILSAQCTDERVNMVTPELFRRYPTPETMAKAPLPALEKIIRSTVFPRTCRHVLRTLAEDGGTWHVAYCPERIAQGHAVRELTELPQIVAGCSAEAVTRATALFALIAPQIVHLEIEEAELAKLFTNAWRYIQFAAANQFYMIAESIGVDFNRVRQAMVDGYGRAASLPSAGFAAGPCLLKDTMQLAAFNVSGFSLGQAAMGINEGLPSFLVDSLKRRHRLDQTRVGILGMTFKADIDDIRDSLSYKLGKVLRFHGADVYYSDEFARDPTFITKEQLVERSDVVIVGVPHSAYRLLAVPAHVEVVDLWGVLPARLPDDTHHLSAR